VSLFTIPYDIKREPGLNHAEREQTLKEIRECSDWLQIIPHGLHHNASEVKDWNYGHMKDYVLPKIRYYFERDWLPYAEGFCAPHWRWNTEVVKALDDMGWWGAISPARPDMLSTKKFFTYDYPIDQSFWESTKDVWRIHGHIGSTGNDLEKCMDNIFKIPIDAEWHYITDFVEEKI
jgi:hypothetical protein